VNGFELDRGELAQAPLTTTTVVGPLDPHNDREAQFLARLRR